MINLSLEYPPSTNRLWRNVKGKTLKSEEYRRWLSGAVPEARYTTKGRVTGPYAIGIVADRPDNRRRDLGNLEKPISDALVTATVISDDSNAAKITLEWSNRPAGKGARVHVCVVPL